MRNDAKPILNLLYENFNVLLIDTNYNRLPINSKITRVHNWNDIYKFISNYNKNTENRKEA